MISWNVNGYRTVMKKAFLSSMRGLDADIVSLRETKLQQDPSTRAMQQKF